MKLAKWGLLQRFVTMLERQGNAQLYRLATFEFRFKLRDLAEGSKEIASKAVADQLRFFVAHSDTPKGIRKDLAAALVGIPDLDDGEATLFVAASSFDACLVDTGDKRALRALSNVIPTQVELASLLGKLACLEQTVAYLIERWGFATIHPAVSNVAPHVDPSVHGCLQSGHEATSMSLLDSKVSQLSAACVPGFLAVQPFGWVP